MAFRGLLGSLVSKAEGPSSIRAPSAGGPGTAPAQSPILGRAPQTAEELASLIAAARAAIRDADLVGRQLEQGGEEGLTDAQLKRWLAARGWDPARAARDLAAHAAWRAEFVRHGRVRECEVSREIGQRKLFVQGVDYRGRAVTILKAGNHIPTANQLEVQRFYCYASDVAIAMADPERNPEGRVVFILDVGEFGLRNFDLMGAKTLFGMMSAHYVERLSHIYFHNAGALLLQLFRLVSPFIDPVTRSKVVFLPSDPQEAAAILAKDLDVAMLPPNLGGSSLPIPVEQARAALDARRAPEAPASYSGSATDEAPASDSASASDEAASDEARAPASSACSEDAVVDFDLLAASKAAPEAGLPLPAEIRVMA
ncbi:hypothetical protein Rsub_12730 [Raphidocelis subcapitata]|uniref:CRAL-TRIO domain-containing protein n=1 Tax=Raphidocelis subcapitata TaxID=307507 RepID=A0A2V0PJZ3_9CHLO|nr:hypothetical protein Rsub_12730 [Raphidocelis subcapitata]|eukprot:GBG00119.1 hypothetical protein Rsub_12730 [Raphidocelis subcapitata]